MNWLKALFWMLIGVGLTLYVSNDNHQVQTVGTTLCLISLLGRLLLYLRDTAPAWEHLKALGEPKLLLLDPPALAQPVNPNRVAAEPVAAPDRSPVQRLLEDEPPG